MPQPNPCGLSPAVSHMWRISEIPLVTFVSGNWSAVRLVSSAAKGSCGSSSESSRRYMAVDKRRATEAIYVSQLPSNGFVLFYYFPACRRSS
jgi:hypothetical protein